jgi:hypothetical protein
MFDPTAYENMRVVMEGIIYDKDLSGEISIVDRNDVINTAKLSRTFDLSFQFNSSSISKVTGRLTLEASLKNLAAELLPTSGLERQAGCLVKIEFLFEQESDQSISIEVDRILRTIWGENRIIKQISRYEPLLHTQNIQHTALILFDRIVTEDQIDDMVEMVDYMMLTLEKLEILINKPKLNNS